MVERKLFGTNGVRGIVNKQLTPEMMLKLSMATGTYFRGADLTVGCDGRVSGPLFLGTVCAGLASVGCQVWNLGLITTPALQFLTKSCKMKGGVMITASHNPPEYNGMKVMGNHGVELPHEEELRIERIYFKEKWSRAEWNRVKEPLLVSEKFGGYFDSIMHNMGGPPRRNLKVLVDAANGVSALSTPTIVEKLGGKASLVNGEIDGTFPGRLPEPNAYNLRHTSRILPNLHVDFGVAHDGDGDRAVFLDERGSVCWGDHTFALVVRDFLEHGSGSRKIVTPISSSQIIEMMAEQYGGEVIYTAVGSVFVSNVMLKLNAMLGGEDNGGVFYSPHVPARDGGITTAMIYRIISESRSPLSKLVADLPRSYIVKDKIPCPDALKARVAESIRNLPNRGKVLNLDGIKMWLPSHSWILIRPSGTEPIVRISVEAPTKGRALKIANEYKSKLSRIIRDSKRHVVQ
ncbi:MAG TPA: phosphoglucosamine mutase [Candidatus Saccharimonadales bacterium]|nr:phosphoglucosamine mutase [Candidatus Saccharimonadales bacterium]